MAYTEDDLKFLRKIGQIVDEPAPVKVAKVKLEPTTTNESEEQVNGRISVKRGRGNTKFGGPIRSRNKRNN